MDKVQHFEVPADDLGRAKKFYSETFGWKIDEVPNLNYHMVYTTEVDKEYMPKEAGAINGGMFDREGGKQGTTIVITVDSLDQAIEKVQAAGGEISAAKTEVPGMGFYARFKDTEGNELGLWEAIPIK